MWKWIKPYWNQLMGEQESAGIQHCTPYHSADENPLHSPQYRHVAHSKELIPNLKNDHQELFNIYSEIFNVIESQPLETIHPILQRLKARFDLHFTQENNALYVYLKQHFANQPARLDLIQQHQKEMYEMSLTINKFIRTWQDQHIDEFNLLEFSQEYKFIGQIIMQQMTREENHLYVLYPPYLT